MSNYWAIAIGINQYQHLHSLLYAQWDAQALWNYWVKEGGIPHYQCQLLTDGITDGMQSDVDIPSTPTKEGIEQQLLHLGHHRLGANDMVWCFFSGYGVNSQGQDYLIPLDAHPQQLEQTSITATQFFSILKSFPTDQVLVLLDVKRLPGKGVESRLGDDIAHQAQASGIATIVASRPDQLSHETLTLRQGLFTATVLEGLRTHGCNQFGQLAQYIQNRLPELSEYHWRPCQEAVMLLSSTQKQQRLLPDIARQPVGTSQGARVESSQHSGQSPPEKRLPPDDIHNDESLSAPNVELPLIYPRGETLQYGPSLSPMPNDLPLPVNDGDRVDELSSVDEPPYDEHRDAKHTPENDPFWPSIIWPGLPLMAAGVLAIVVLRNLDTLTGKVSPPTVPIPTENNRSRSTTGGSPNGGAVPRSAADPLAKSRDISSSVNTSASVPTGETSQSGAGQFVAGQFGGGLASALEKAKASMAAAEYEEALQWLSEVPPNAQTEEYAQLVTEAEQLRNQSGQTNQAILDEAIASLNQPRESTTVNQASDYGRAMGLAHRIQRGQPFYEEAQQYIQRWGQNILDLANSRAISGDYGDAIATAQLIEPDFPLLYQQAQRWVKEWEQYKDAGTINQGIIEAARSTIRYDSASSYNQAIGKLRSIQAGQPKYVEAQQLIDEWSREILDIANWRAKSGNFYSAIDAANLVPEGTEVYLEAREAIAEWRRQLGGA